MGRRNSLESELMARLSENVKGLVLGASLTLLALLAGCQFQSGGNDFNSLGMKALASKNYDQAEEYFSKAIAQVDGEIGRAGGTPSVKLVRQLAFAYGNLGQAQKEHGRYSDAANSYARAIDLLDGPEVPHSEEFLLQCTHELGILLFNQRKLVDAEHLCRQELALATRLFGPDSARGATAANNLAQICQLQGKNCEAEKFFKTALDMCQRSGGSESDRLKVDILNNYAIFCEKTGNYPDARELVERALKLQNPSSALYVSDRVKSLFVLALINKDTYEFEQAEQNYHEALSLIDKTKSGGKLLCEGLDHYADLLQAERKFDEAQPVYTECIAVCEKTHGKDHPDVAERLSDFAVLCRRTGRAEQAKGYLQRALAIQEKSMGVDSPLYLETVNRLTAVLRELGDFQEADQLYANLIDRLRKKVGPDHPYLADALENEAMFAEKLRGKKAADKLRSNAKLIRTRLAGTLKPADLLQTPVPTPRDDDDSNPANQRIENRRL